MKICGLRVDIQEVQGPFYKVVGIKEFPDLIYNGKFRGPSLRCGGLAARSGPRWTAGGVDTRRGAGWPGATGFSGGAAGVGRHGVGDRADSWGPLDRERRERTRPAWKARTKKENIFPWRRHRHTGQMGRVRKASAYRGKEAGRAGWAKGQVGR
jgi:hypothetical protein